jgi:hypothetical protein
MLTTLKEIDLPKIELLTLAKLLRKNSTTLQIKDAYYSAKLILEAYRLGEIRGCALK